MSKWRNVEDIESVMKSSSVSAAAAIELKCERRMKASIEWP
jgi:hypothetical protein